MPQKSVNNLVIVESPAKAKTIEKFLGNDFEVKSSLGHIRDLPKKGLSIDIEHEFAPKYEISPDKKKTVAELKKIAKNKTVWLASDEDREGEAIAWHLTHALNLDPKTTKRIVFHEITKTAIDNAIKTPRTVDINLVNAQQARRVLDRLVGYELSPVLWKKVRAGLSAGRVQSVAVRLIVEREREIQKFTPKISFKVIASFSVKKQDFTAELSERLNSYEEAKEFLELLKDADFTVSKIEKKPSKRKPGPPFTTSTLQQEAARKLGYSVRQTMTLAQRLYEGGHITYMRTDSTVLSSLAIKSAEDYITKEFGKIYHQVRQFKTKNQSAQEAHEAIRPTDFKLTKITDDTQLSKLYQLIWQRALASQMSDAETERTELTIAISNHALSFVAKGETLRFPGFMQVYGGIKDDTLLPVLEEGSKLSPSKVEATETFSRAPARYSEASLVKKLEELGIGRPSTYAPTISTIQTRGYIEKSDLEGRERDVRLISLVDKKVTENVTKETTGADKNKLLPTPIAEITTDFLIKYFENIVDYQFTANMEGNFDLVADGKNKWQDIIKEFYSEFHPLIGKSEGVSRHEVSQARLLGEDPKSHKPIYARYGRYGPMLQRGETESEEKPDFAPMPTGVKLEDVTLEQALIMFKLPRTVGKTEDGQEIKANIGRFGPYIQVEKLYVSIKGYDPHTISEKDARKLYKEKLEKEAEKLIATFPSGIKVQKGPYGPYITDGKKNARIAKDMDPQKITEEEAKKILESAPATRRFKRRKKASK